MGRLMEIDSNLVSQSPWFKVFGYVSHEKIERPKNPKNRDLKILKNIFVIRTPMAFSHTLKKQYADSLHYPPEGLIVV